MRGFRKALFRTRTGDPLLTMRSKRQLVAACGKGFALFKLFLRLRPAERLPPVAPPLFQNCSIPIGPKRALRGLGSGVSLTDGAVAARLRLSTSRTFITYAMEVRRLPTSCSAAERSCRRDAWIPARSLSRNGSRRQRIFPVAPLLRRVAWCASAARTERAVCGVSALRLKRYCAKAGRSPSEAA